MHRIQRLPRHWHLKGHGSLQNIGTKRSLQKERDEMKMTLVIIKKEKNDKLQEESEVQDKRNFFTKIICNWN